MNQNPAQAYRHHRVHSSSGVGLIIMLYETAISSLQKANSALQAKDIEQRDEFPESRPGGHCRAPKLS